MNALELADALEAEPDCTCHAACYIECSCDAIWPEQYTLTAADELRRLHAENESLKADAERYRYLRNRYPSDVLDKTGLEAGAWIDCEDINGTLVLLTGEHADETIDAERGKS